MIYDLQKASILKRISAWLLDFILLVMLIVGVAAALSAVLGFDVHEQKMEESYAFYEQKFGVKFDMTLEEYEALSQEGRDNYDAAYEALIADEEAMRTYNLIVSLSMVIVTFSVLISYLLLEFAVPMMLRNGQTVGKKVFGIGVMRTSGVRVNGVCMFIRAILGKYAVETMIPVFIVLMLMFGLAGAGGTLVILLLAAVELVMVIVTRTNSLIHDKLADTVTVDFASQMIFDTEEDLLEYKKRVAAEQAARDPYA